MAKPQTGGVVNPKPTTDEKPVIEDEKPVEDEKPAEDTKPAEPVYSSPKLTEIDAEIDKVSEAAETAGLRTPEGKKLMAKIWALEQSRETEINVIKAQLKKLADEEADNKIIALNDIQFELRDAMLAANDKLSKIPVTDRTAETPELLAANAAKKAFDDAREVVVNRLLGGKHLAQGTAKRTAAASNGAAKVAGAGTNRAKIQEIIAPLYASMTPTEIRAHVIKTLGFNDGTANEAILSYERANYLNGKSPKDV